MTVDREHGPQCYAGCICERSGGWFVAVGYLVILVCALIVALW